MRSDDGAAVADELEQLRGDQRRGLHVIETEASRQPLLRQNTRLVEHQLVDLSWCQMHECLLTIFAATDHRRAAPE